MSGGNISPGPTEQREPIHFCAVFGRAGYDAPTACGRTSQPKPASDRWENVTCGACLAKSPPGAIAARLMARGRGKSVVGGGS